MMAITTSSSISVNARRVVSVGKIIAVEWFRVVGADILILCSVRVLFVGVQVVSRRPYLAEVGSAVVGLIFVSS